MATELEKRNAAAYFTWLIDWYRRQHVLPAVGVGLVLGGEVVLSLARGVRKHGTNTPVQPTDRFQMGSITKPMTGMLMARLVHKGVIGWGQTIQQTWPDLFDAIGAQSPYKAHYSVRNVVDLMTHTSGMHYKPEGESAELYAAIHPLPTENQMAKRKLYTQLAIMDEPLDPSPYSGGCIVCAGIAQQKTGKTWEELIRSEVFAPLGITHIAIGPMSKPDSVTDIWQHRIEDGTVQAVYISSSHLGQVEWTHGPAGAVGLSMPDCGKWVAAMLTEPTTFMSSKVWGEYFGVPDTAPGMTRGGWSGDGTSVGHDGNNNWNHASLGLNRTKKVGTFAATNIDTPQCHQVIGDLRAELEAAADVWPAMGYLHEAVPPTRVKTSADSVWDNTGMYAPALMSDTWWRTRWAASSTTPTISVTLDQPRMLKGIVLCEAYGPRVQRFELEITPDTGATPQGMSWTSLSSRTARTGLVVRTLFASPVKAKSFKLRITAASDAPTLSRLLVLDYAQAAVSDFDIDAGGRLWVVQQNTGRVLTSVDTVSKAAIVLAIDTGGVAGAVRKSGAARYVIGTDAKVWKDAGSGWTALADPSTVTRIAVDASTNVVWSIDANRRIRRHDGTSWAEFTPAGGEGKDLAVHAGTPYVVGMDDAIWRGGAGGWQPVTGASPKMKRIAIDESSGTLWTVGIDGRIRSLAPGKTAWVEHPGGGLAKAITVYGGKPYVIGTNDAIWRSAGTAGWSMLTVLHDHPPPA
jgi:CubicO group peptidase (beta-lactamase class C family)